MSPTPRKPRRPSGERSGPAYAEAESRVADAATRGATELDLRISGLTRIPQLSALSALKLLDLSGTDISDITPISSLFSLQKLYLNGTRVSDWTPLEKLTALQTLDLSRTSISDLKPLSGMLALQFLALTGTRVLHLAPLAGLTALRVVDLKRTRVADLSALTNLTELQTLDLSETPVSDLAPLADLTKLRTLYLQFTFVSNLAPIARMVALRTLDLSFSRAVDIGPLADRITLLALDLSSTKVSDLTPLAGLSALIGGAYDGGGLNCSVCPLSDATLLAFSNLDNPKRTEKIINYLREQQGLEPYYPGAKADDVQALPIRELGIRLQQDNGATRVVRQGDQLALAPSGAEIDAAVANQPMARQLHDRLRPKAKALADFAIRVSNLPGWQDFAEDTKAMRQLVELPLSDIAERVAEFWCLSGSLGAFLEQDEKAEHPSSMTLQLAADGRRLLSQVVEISAVLTRQFPTAEKLDSELRAALHKPERVEPAKATIEIAGETQLLRADHVILLHAALVGPKSGGPQSQKAHDRSVRTTRNVVFGALVAGGIFINAGIAEGYLDEIGGEIARHDILARRIEDFVVKGEKDIADLLDGEPADKKAAVNEMIRRIKNKDAAPLGRQGKDGK